MRFPGFHASRSPRKTVPARRTVVASLSITYRAAVHLGLIGLLLAWVSPSAGWAQTRAATGRPFASLTAGGWNTGGLRLNEPILLTGGASAGAFLSPHAFVELRYTRYGMGQSDSVGGVSLGIFIQPTDTAHSSAGYFGASIGQVSSDATVGLHFGVLDRLGDRWGVRLEAAGRIFRPLAVFAQAEGGLWVRF